VAKGELRGPVVDRELPLAQAAESHRLIEERQTFGKVVLKA
jgi:NADPH:quinone reductase-like Zn-dependent oxidoreductase